VGIALGFNALDQASAYGRNRLSAKWQQKRWKHFGEKLNLKQRLTGLSH